MFGDPPSTIPPKASRRTALRALGAAALAPWLSDEGARAFQAVQRSSAPAVLRALTEVEFLTLQAYVEAILPADERSPGAREARVAEYVDLLLSEVEDEARGPWREGLRAVDAASRARFGSPFAELGGDDAATLLGEWSVREKAPEGPLEQFFVAAKSAAIRGYYTSELGLHRELRYKGNTFTPEFVGCRVEEGEDCPHCGRKAGG